MEIRKGTLVACNMWGTEEGGRTYPPDQKRAIGVVVEQNYGPPPGCEDEMSFAVKLIYPPHLKDTTIGVLETDLTPLSQTSDTVSEEFQDNLPQIILTLVRRIEALEKANVVAVSKNPQIKPTLTSPLVLGGGSGVGG